MEYGFVIDQRKCIGCHACTVACKAENEVPVGSFRTWVKYVDKGAFPSVRRHFTVLRCNHCDQAPCVEICPVVALHKRPDRIVDLDRDLCIGCQACMQACPYDALYLNPDSGTAEKCHYCAHRTELGLEPACVIVCPEEAIVSGDVGDPESRIARMIAELPTAQRKLEKGTQPRVWYVDALEEALVPGAALEPDTWLWSQRAAPPAPELHAPAAASAAASGAVTTLNVDHPPVWGWHIWTYLLTKNVAAGAMLCAPLATLEGALRAVPETTALVFLAITGFLLVHDLGRPERFLKILFHANPRSWLVRGTWVLAAFGALTAASLAALVFEQAGLARALRFANLPLAVLASGYSAFLFAQCRGRDLWIQPGLFTGLVLRAFGCGAAVLLLAAGLAAPPAWVAWIFAAAALANAGLLIHEEKRPLATRDAERARAHLAEHGTLWAAAALCALAALAALAPSFAVAPGVASLASLAGRSAAALLLFCALLAYERAWVRAGQAVPLS